MSRVVGFPMMHYTNPVLDDPAAAMAVSQGPGDRRLAPYIALSRLARALTGDAERASLFLSLPHELRKIIRADVLTLELHNEKTRTADMHVLFPRGSALAFAPAD